jgi:hypothetical protein
MSAVRRSDTGFFERCQFCRAWCANDELHTDEAGNVLCPRCVEGACAACGSAPAREHGNLCHECVESLGLTRLFEMLGSGVRITPEDDEHRPVIGFLEGIGIREDVVAVVLRCPDGDYAAAGLRWEWTHLWVPLQSSLSVELCAPLAEGWWQTGSVADYSRALAWLQMEAEVESIAAADEEREGDAEIRFIAPDESREPHELSSEAYDPVLKDTGLSPTPPETQSMNDGIWGMEPDAEWVQDGVYDPPHDEINIRGDVEREHECPYQVGHRTQIECRSCRGATREATVVLRNVYHEWCADFGYSRRTISGEVVVVCSECRGLTMLGLGGLWGEPPVSQYP